tara:strand:+ start:38 stop:232 length:195 start_codon:yes stop_codon:yes gene_type:complete
MAKYDLKFLDCVDNSHISTTKKGSQIEIQLYGSDLDETLTVWLDKSTAIKFAKTLRTEINKIQD